ncbi:hypothetical protein ACEWJV_09515, partial [Escherichia coli]
RKPGKEARHHIAVLRNLIMCEIDDFVRGTGPAGRASNTGRNTQRATPPHRKRGGLRNEPERLTRTRARAG